MRFAKQEDKEIMQWIKKKKWTNYSAEKDDWTIPECGIYHTHKQHNLTSGNNNNIWHLLLSMTHTSTTKEA